MLCGVAFGAARLHRFRFHPPLQYPHIKKRNMKYEEAIKNLESIVSMMESGKLDLDQLEEKLKEAQQLIKLCRDKLTKTDEEISKLLQQ